jgi:hypothetical protein
MFYRAKEERSSEKYKNAHNEMVLGAKKKHPRSNILINVHE